MGSVPTDRAATTEGTVGMAVATAGAIPAGVDTLAAGIPAAVGIERLTLESAEEQDALGEVVTFAVTKSNYAAKPDRVLLRRDASGAALLPLDNADVARVAPVLGKDPARTERRKAREDEQSARATAEDNAVVQAVRERPGIPLRELVKRVQAIAHCGANRAEVAIERTRERLDVRDGPRRTRLHYLAGTDA